MNRAPAAPVLVALSVVALLSACPDQTPPTGSVRNYSYTVVNEFPHDRAAFTQGLVYDNGVLYESTGLYGESTLRRVDLQTGTVQQSVALGGEFFGEGVATFEDTILQLTWRSNLGFIYDRETFDLIGEFTYSSQGWGITHDGEELIMSDGTATIRFLDPATFEVNRSIEVFDTEGPLRRLNELEYIDGAIYANVWLTDFIAIIDPETGEVLSWIDLTGLRPESTTDDGNAVLNGIAYDPQNDRLFVTGKRWPKIFEIELVPLEET